MSPPTQDGDYIGLDFGAHALKAALVRDGEIVTIGRVPLGEGVIVGGSVEKPVQLADAVKELVTGKLQLEQRDVVFSLSHPVLSSFKTLTLPTSDSSRDVELVISAYAEALFAPIELSKMTIDYAELSRTASRLDLQIVAADRRLVAGYERALRKAGYNPYAAELGALATSRALVVPRTKGSAHLVVDIGAEKISFTVASGPDVLFSRIIAGGGNEITRSLVERLAISWQEAERLKQLVGLTLGIQIDGVSEETVTIAQEAMLEPIDKMVQALADTRAFYEQQQTGRPLDGVTFIGGTARMRDLVDTILPYLGFERASLPRARSGYGSAPDIDVYATAIGLAAGPTMSLLERGKRTARVDVNRAKRRAKRLRRRKVQTNPLVYGLLVALLVCGLAWYQGKRIKEEAKTVLASAPAPVKELPPLRYTGPQATPLVTAAARLATQGRLPNGFFADLSALASRFKVSVPSFEYEEGGKVIFTGKTPGTEEKAGLTDAISKLSGIALVGDESDPMVKSEVPFRFTLQLTQKVK